MLIIWESRFSALLILVQIIYLACCNASLANSDSSDVLAAIAEHLNSTKEIRESSGCPDIMQTLNDIVQQLEEKKTSRYPPARPHGKRETDANAVQVQINLLPLHLMHVDDARSQLALGLLVLINWNDPRLAWVNTTKYDPACKSRLPARLSLRDIRDIWTPILVLAESTASTKRGLHEIFESMQISQTGTVFYAGRYRDDLICPMKRRFYPFDEQVCNITVLGGDFVRYEVGTSWTRYFYSSGGGGGGGGKRLLTNSRETNWLNGTDTTDEDEDFIKWVLQSYRKTEYETHVFGRQLTTNEWKLNPTDEQLVASLTRPIVIRHAVRPPVGQHSEDEVLQSQSLVFQLFLKRDAWPLVWTMVIPPILISVAAVVGMYLGCPIQARFGFGATVVISLSLLIRSLSDRLETGDDGSPLLHWLYLGLLTSLLLATTLSEIPHRMAKRRKLQMFNEETGGSGTGKKSKSSWMVATFGIEETINLYFAVGFLLTQLLLIGYAVVMWLTMPSLKIGGLDQ